MKTKLYILTLLGSLLFGGPLNAQDFPTYDEMREEVHQALQDAFNNGNEHNLERMEVINEEELNDLVLKVAEGEDEILEMLKEDLQPFLERGARIVCFREADPSNASMSDIVYVRMPIGLTPDESLGGGYIIRGMFPNEKIHKRPSDWCYNCTNCNGEGTICVCTRSRRSDPGVFCRKCVQCE